MIKLLIIDDNRASQIVLGASADATKAGLTTEIHYARTLEQGLILTEKIRPELTFLDLNLPDADIDKVLAAIEGMTPPVIVISGMPRETIRAGKVTRLENECIRAGAEDFLEKTSEGYKAAQEKWLAVVLQKKQAGALTRHDQ